MPSLEDTIKSKAYILFTQVFRENEARSQDPQSHQRTESHFYHQIMHDFVEYVWRCQIYKQDTEKSPLLMHYLEKLPEDLTQKLLSLVKKG